MNRRPDWSPLDAKPKPKWTSRFCAEWSVRRQRAQRTIWLTSAAGHWGSEMIPLGIRIYGLGAIATGLVGLAWGDFALQWEPVAASFPGRTALAYIFSALLVVAGAAVNWRRSSAALGAAALVGLYAVVVVLMHGAEIVQQPVAFVAWDGAAEQLALLAGGLASYACLAGASGVVGRGADVGRGTVGGPGADVRRGANVSAGGGAEVAAAGGRGASRHVPLRAGAQLSSAALICMGVCLLMFGLAHFLYLDFTASMVPAWLPGGQKFWAVLTGAAHLAAGVALLSGIKARLAANLLTVMFASFSVLVHLPLLIANPHSHLNWVMNAINLALTGAAWAIATALTQTDTHREELAAGVVRANFAGERIRQGQES
jgi:uncharacterized membrane protein YphA (DoxX/SURF4 family)